MLEENGQEVGDWFKTLVTSSSTAFSRYGKGGGKGQGNKDYRSQGKGHETNSYNAGGKGKLHSKRVKGKLHSKRVKGETTLETSEVPPGKPATKGPARPSAPKFAPGPPPVPKQGDYVDNDAWR